MLAKTKSSIEKFKINDLINIVDLAKSKRFKNLYFITSGRGAKLAYSYQKKYKNDFIKGYISHLPHLIKGKLNIGEDSNYEQIAKHSNLLIYMIFSDSSTKFLCKNKITNLLKIGGSDVFI